MLALLLCFISLAVFYCIQYNDHLTVSSCRQNHWSYLIIRKVLQYYFKFGSWELGIERLTDLPDRWTPGPSIVGQEVLLSDRPDRLLPGQMVTRTNFQWKTSSWFLHWSDTCANLSLIWGGEGGLMSLLSWLLVRGWEVPQDILKRSEEDDV